MPQNNDFQDDDCFNQLKTCLFNSFSCFFNSRRHEYQEIPEMSIPVKTSSPMALTNQLVDIPASDKTSPDSVSNPVPKKRSCLRSNSTGGITKKSNNPWAKQQVRFSQEDKIFLIPNLDDYRKKKIHTRMWTSHAESVKIIKNASQDCVDRKFVFPSDEVIAQRDAMAALNRQIPRAASLREISLYSSR